MSQKKNNNTTSKKAVSTKVKNAPAAKKPESSTKAAAANKPAAKPANKVDPKETPKIAAILTAICLVITIALAGTNMLTKDIIAQAAQEAKEATCRTVIPAESYAYLSDAFDGFDGCDAYLALNGGVVCGAAITTESKGYGGTIQVMTGIDETGRVTGVSVLDHSETAGLGANASKPKFLNQFITSGDELQPGSYAVSKDGGEIDAVTAATISSRAVTAAVNEALEVFESIRSAGLIGMQLEAAAIAEPVEVSGSDLTGGVAE